MASLRMLLSAVSLSITLLLWPPTSPAGPKSCAELMNDIYKQVEFEDLHDYLQNELKRPQSKGRLRNISTIPCRHSKRPARRKRIASKTSRMGITSRSWRRHVRNERRHFATLRPPATFLIRN